MLPVWWTLGRELTVWTLVSHMERPLVITSSNVVTNSKQADAP